MAQDWRVHALVYFCSAVDDLFGAVLHWHLDLELADMKTIIEMAREAGWMHEHDSETGFVAEAAFKFAALVRADERDKREWNFCPRCGKRTADLTTIHTCTPPRENT